MGRIEECVEQHSAVLAAGPLGGHLIYGFILAGNAVNCASLLNGELRALWVHLGGSASVEPGDGSAQGWAVRCDHAGAGGGEGLAQGAAVEDIDVLIVQSLGALVAGLVDIHGLGQLGLNCGRVGDYGDLQFLDEWHLGLVQLDDRGEDLYPGGDAFLLQALAYSHPDIISLV